MEFEDGPGRWILKGGGHKLRHTSFTPFYVHWLQWFIRSETPYMIAMSVRSSDSTITRERVDRLSSNL